MKAFIEYIIRLGGIESISFRLEAMSAVTFAHYEHLGDITYSCVTGKIISYQLSH
jgi:hypothetical protein